MKSPGKRTHAFLVRFWLEHREIAGRKPLLRGDIEPIHIDIGKENVKRYGLNNLFEIAPFIQRYFEQLGVKFSKIEQILQYLKAQRKAGPKVK